MTSVEDRRLIARWSHRFGFGPKPGQFRALVDSGIDRAFNSLIDTTPSLFDIQLINELLSIKDLGDQPRSNTPQIVPYANEKRRQIRALTLWWISVMSSTDNPLSEIGRAHV